MKKVRVFPTRAGGIALLFVAALFAGNVRLGAAPAAPVQNPAVVLGPDVTLSWTPVPGATSYRLAVGVAPGQTALSQSVGNVSQIGVKAPFVGTYYVRVFASDATGESPASNEVPVVVTAMSVPPAAPTDLAAYVNGTSALITWSGGAGGDQPCAVRRFGSGRVRHRHVPRWAGHAVVGAERRRGQLLPSDRGGERGRTEPGLERSPPPDARGRRLLGATGAQLHQQRVRPLRPVWLAGCSRRRRVSTGFQPNARWPDGSVACPLGRPPPGYAVTGAPLGVFYGRLVTAFSCGAQTWDPRSR